MIHTEIDNYADTLDVRDIIKRVQDLLETSNGSVADGTDGAEYEGHEEDHEEYATLMALLNELRGRGGDEQWKGDWYPLTLIRDTYFREYAMDIAEDIGAIPDEYTWPVTCIDWHRAAGELRMDYTSVDFGGVIYWYR